MMSIFNAVRSRKSVSQLALAFVLSSSAAVGLTAVAAPAHAQNDEDEAEAKKYSDAFVAVYNPVEAQIKDSATDPAVLVAAVPSVIAAIETPDDRFVAGSLAYNVGKKAQNAELQRQGLKLIIGSGRLPPENIGQYNMMAGQLAYQAKDFLEARKYVQAAVDAGYTQNDPEILLAETYFQENNIAEGLRYLDAAIAKRKAAGQPIDESWIKRGLAFAYNGDLPDKAFDYAILLVENHPSADAWGDAIAILRNYNDYDDHTTLDLLRLAARTDTLRTSRDYLDYVVAADPRRLPGEVQRIIDQGVAAGILDAGNPFVEEAKATAAGRIAADKAEMSELEADARAANATAVTATAAGDVFLSYGQPAKAEELYQIALSKPGVETARVLTRLGIAQADQGKVEDAKLTFAKVEGARQAIARLWSAYAGSQGAM